MRRICEDEFPDNGFEAWGGYMQAKIAKLEAQFADRAASDENRCSDIFSGISIYVNGYTRPSASELKTLMAQHGGVYHNYQRPSDFIIASNLPDTKVKRLTTARIVKPEWITESIASNCLLDFKDYLLYSKNTRLQPKLNFRAIDSIKTESIKCEPHTGIQSEHQILNVTKKLNFDSEANTSKVKSPHTKVIKTEMSQDASDDRAARPNQQIAVDPHFDGLSQFNDEMVEDDNDVIPNSPEAIINYSRKSTPQNTPKLRKIGNEIADSNYLITEEQNTSKVSINENDSKSAASNNTSDLVPQPMQQVADTIKNKLLTDGSARTAVDPKFLSEFYNNSRLHHISQLGAAFKQYVNELRDASDFKFPMRQNLLRRVKEQGAFQSSVVTNYSKSKVIMHIDMDCFFVSVGLRNHPELRGQPVAVTHSKGRSAPQKREGVDRQAEFKLYKQRHMKTINKPSTEVESMIEEELETRVDGVDNEEDGMFGSMSEIASCSYEARALGIKNGMFMGPALRLCPNLKTLPYNFDGYKEVAYTLYNTVAQYTLDIEAVSCDEMYVDCADILQKLNLTVDQFAAALRSEIKEKTGCPCSAGFGSNRLQARLATKKAKPDGQFYLTPDAVIEYIQDVSLSDLPGVGRQMQNKLSSLNYTTCGSLLSATLASMQKQFGNKTGQLLYDYCRGLDTKPLSFVTVRKSVSAEVNYGIRFEDFAQCETFLRQLCGEVQSRLQQFKVKGKAITLKLMVRSEDAPVETAKFMGHGFCDNVTKTATLQYATDDLNIITTEILNICRKLNVDPKEMRGIGIQISKLENFTKSDKNKNTFRNYLLKGKTKPVDGAGKSNKTYEIKKENEYKSGNVEKFKVLPDSSTNSNENLKQSDAETDKEKKGMFILKDDHNKFVKIDMYNNILKVEKTPTKFAAVDGAIKRSPIKNNIMSDFLKGHRSPASVSKIKTEPITPKVAQTPSTKRSLPYSTVQPGSPPRKKSLGMTKRKRGRPPKSGTSTSTPKANGSRPKGAMNKFLNSAPGNHEEDDIDMSDLDQEVLAALPEEIKKEVLEQHRKEKNKSVTVKLSKRTIAKIPQDKVAEPDVMIDKEFLDALPVDIRREVEREYLNKPKNFKRLSDTDLAQPGPSSRADPPSKTEPQKHDMKGNILSMPWEQIREMLRAWLNLEKVPLHCDVDLMSSYMQHLVVNRDIESLNILLNFLYRHVSDKSECEWHEAYLHILSGVQDTMVTVYNKKLLAKSFFACCYHPS